LVRECREELGVDVTVGVRVGADLRIATGRVMRVYAAEIVAGEAQPLEHLALCWVGLGDLTDLNWLLADRPLLPALAELLRARG
jgi:8-oxo-dGTP diphosphatase